MKVHLVINGEISIELVPKSVTNKRYMQWALESNDIVRTIDVRVSGIPRQVNHMNEKTVQPLAKAAGSERS